MEIKCVRCGKKLEKKHYMLQVAEYLGELQPRVDICDDCFKSYTNWILGGETMKNMTAMGIDTLREIADDFLNDMLKGAHVHEHNV